MEARGTAQAASEETKPENAPSDLSLPGGTGGFATWGLLKLAWLPCAWQTPMHPAKPYSGINSSVKMELTSPRILGKLVTACI